jgi:hypothetical protein
LLRSYEKKFLFVHIEKTAGSSIADALQKYAHRPERDTPAKWLDRIGIHANYVGPHTWRRFRIHATAATARRHLPADVFDSLYKFAFVRNPYERLLSQYRFILRYTPHHRHETVKQLGSFGRYVAWEAERNKRTQHAFVFDRRARYLLDFVGRFESLAEDYQSVCDRIGIPCKLPGGNEGNSRDYVQAFADPQVRADADRLLGRDAKLFGYTLDGPMWDTAELNERLAKLR